jgi:hypothetical protein
MVAHPLVRQPGDLLAKGTSRHGTREQPDKGGLDGKSESTMYFRCCSLPSVRRPHRQKTCNQVWFATNGQ